VSRKITSSTRNFLSTLLPLGKVGKVPDIPDELRQLVKNIVFEAIKLQDLICMKYSQHDCELFLPSPLTSLDPMVMILVDAKTPNGDTGSWGLKAATRVKGDKDFMVSVAVKLGLRIAAGRDSKVLVRAGVICT
jgi:hypothetical protein